MAKEVGQKATEKQFEIMEEQQNKAQEFIDQKVISQLVNSFWLFIFPSLHFPLLSSKQIYLQFNPSLLFTDYNTDKYREIITI